MISYLDRVHQQKKEGVKTSSLYLRLILEQSRYTSLPKQDQELLRLIPNVSTQLASVASPPSDENRRFSLSIYIYITRTVHTVMPYVLLILRVHSPVRQQCLAFH